MGVRWQESTWEGLTDALHSLSAFCHLPGGTIHRMARSLIRKSTALTIGALVALMLTQTPPLAHAEGDLEKERDQERARRALEQGEVRPLAEILQIVGARIDGEIVETEFEREDGVWVYEIKYITRSGRMQEIYVDALSARIIKVEDD